MGDRSKIEVRRAKMADLARMAQAPRPLLAAVRCSFCSAKGTEVGHIFAGSSAFICDECIDALYAALAERRKARET
jgi:hypothetical protein